MYFNRAPSSSSLPNITQNNEEQQESFNQSNEKQDDNQDVIKEQKKPTSPGERTRKRLKNLNLKKTPDPSNAPKTLRMRERSTSSPLIIRPVSNSKDSISDPSKTPERKSNATSDKADNSDIPSRLNSSDISSTPNAKSEKRLPSSAPKLRSKNLHQLQKILTTDQRLANDLADLLGMHFLKNSGRVDDEIAMHEMTARLQNHLKKPVDSKIRIDELMLKMFSNEMKASDAWSIASRTVAQIKTAYYLGKSEPSNPEGKKEKEIDETVQVLVGSFVGSFFNTSGQSKIRLPKSLHYFCQAADYQKIRSLLSTDAGKEMSHEKFMEARKTWLAKSFLDTFLIPLVMKEFFSVRGSAESDKIAAYIIDSFHAAMDRSALELLDNSLKSPPDDIAKLMLKRRTFHFDSRINRQTNESKERSPKEKSGFSREMFASASQLSPVKGRRDQLSKLLEKIEEKLSPNKLSKETLLAIRSLNRELCEYKKELSEKYVLSQWLDIADKNSENSDVVSVLNALKDNTTEHSEFDRNLVELDIFAKLNAIESAGEALAIERARRLSSNLPITPSSSNTVSTTHTSATLVQQKPKRSPASSNRPTQHRRSKTADFLMTTERSLSSELTPKQRTALINLFPDLLLKSSKAAAMITTEDGEKFKNNPIGAIWQAGRFQFLINSKDIPVQLRLKIFPISSSVKEKQSISHTKLLNLLMMDQLKSSVIGVKILEHRSESLRNASLTEKFQPKINPLIDEIFSGGLDNADIPTEILETCKIFDRKITQWISDDLLTIKPTITPESITELRSNLIFDLLITRLLYPLVMSGRGKQLSENETIYASAFQRSLKAKWDNQLFNDFLRIQGEIKASSKPVAVSAEAEPLSKDGVSQE